MTRVVVQALVLLRTTEYWLEPLQTHFSQSSGSLQSRLPASVRLREDWVLIEMRCSPRWMLFSNLLTFFIGLSYAEQMSVQILPMRMEAAKIAPPAFPVVGTNGLAGRKKQKKTQTLLASFPPGACGRMNELICSHCASWIYSHALLWYPTSMGYCKLMTSAAKAHLHEIWPV